MEKFEQSPREYRKGLAKTLKSVKNIDSESAEFLLSKEKNKEEYTHAEDLVRFQHNLEQEVKNFEHGSFNVHRVENIDKKTIKELENLGYKTEKEVFVSIGSNNGFELLKAIDKELKTRDGFTVYFVNEYENTRGDRSEVKIIKLPIPFEGLPFDEIKNVETGQNTILKAMEHASKGTNIMSSATQWAGGNYQHVYRVIEELKENKSDLLNQWTEYLKENFNKTGLKKEEWTTHDSHMGDTRSHSALKNDPEATEKIFKEFLKEHNVDVVTTSSKVGDYKKQIPVATEAYNILMNKDKFEYGYEKEKEKETFARSFFQGQENSKKSIGLYSEKVALEILSRPNSILDESYDSVKEWREKNSRRRY